MAVRRIAACGVMLASILIGSFAAMPAAALPPGHATTATAPTIPPSTTWAASQVNFSGADPLSNVTGFLPTIVEGPDGQPWYLEPSMGLFSASTSQPPVLHALSVPAPASNLHALQPAFDNLAAASDHSLWLTIQRTASEKPQVGENDTFVAHVTAAGTSIFQIASDPYSPTARPQYWYLNLRVLSDGNAEVFRYTSAGAWQAIHVTTAGAVTTTNESAGIPPTNTQSTVFQSKPDGGYFWSFDASSSTSPKIQRLALDGSLTQFPAPAGAQASWPYGQTWFTTALDGTELFTYAINGTPHTGGINADGSVTADAPEQMMFNGTWTTGSTTTGLVLHRASNPDFAVTLPPGYSIGGGLVWSPVSDTGWVLASESGRNEEVLQISGSGTLTARSSPEYVDNLTIADDGTVWMWYSQGSNVEVVRPSDEKVAVITAPNFYMVDFASGQTAWYFTYGMSSPQLKLMELDPRNSLSAPVFGIGDLNGDGKPDFLAREPDGSLWLYEGTGTVNATSQGYLPRVQIGSGWNAYNSIIGVGDLDGDGHPDLVARKPDGTLWFAAGRPGTADSPPSFAPAVQIGSGWNAYSDLIASGDFNGDGIPDLLARKADGTLWFFPGIRSGSFGSGLQIGFGWNSYRQIIGIGDLNHDSKPDLIGVRPDGSLWFYAGTGSISDASSGYLPGVRLRDAANPAAPDILSAVGDLDSNGYPDMLAVTANGALQFIGGANVTQEGYAPAKKIGTSGWNNFTQLTGVGDFNGDGKADLLASRADGTLWFYAGTGNVTTSTGYAPGHRVGSGGWNAYTKLIGAGDFNGDGHADLLGVRANGELWFYAGTGAVTGTTNGYAAGTRIGTGWGVYTALVAGDFNGDHKPDLLGIRQDGSLWFYAGTGTVGSGSSGYAAGVQVGSGWAGYNSLVAGDFNGDGKTDLIARTANGSLWFWPGSNGASSTTAGLGNKEAIGTGWGIYRSVTGVSDFNGDGRPDFVGIRSDGTLWFYASNGESGIPSPALRAPLVAGSSWNIYG